jgi:3-oxoacyl-[acyl-carrier-protein] synthase-3
MFFYDKVKEVMKSIDFEVPDERWFTNLPWVGNVGSASIFLILDEMLRNSMLKKGQKILLMVPESARFSYGYAHLTVV